MCVCVCSLCWVSMLIYNKAVVFINRRHSACMYMYSMYIVNIHVYVCMFILIFKSFMVLNLRMCMYINYFIWMCFS